VAGRAGGPAPAQALQAQLSSTLYLIAQSPAEKGDLGGLRDFRRADQKGVGETRISGLYPS
jgi:hypothetical protein